MIGYFCFLNASSTKRPVDFENFRSVRVQTVGVGLTKGMRRGWMALKMEAEIDFRIIANPLGCSFYSCELILEEVLGSWLSSIGKIEKVFSFGG